MLFCLNNKLFICFKYKTSHNVNPSVLIEGRKLRCTSATFHNGGKKEKKKNEEKQQLCPLLYSVNYCAVLIVCSLQFHQAMKEMNDVWGSPVESSAVWNGGSFVSVYCAL